MCLMPCSTIHGTLQLQEDQEWYICILSITSPNGSVRDDHERLTLDRAECTPVTAPTHMGNYNRSRTTSNMACMHAELHLTHKQS